MEGSHDTTLANEPALIDPFGRRVSYLRLSLTDRCDFRCTYCMSEHMKFLPKSDLLTFEELTRLVDLFIASGISKLRLTGGEPLVRKGVFDFIDTLGERLSTGLEELTLTTNGSQLITGADRLARAGIKRINVSIDSLKDDRFKEITRRGDLKGVLLGLEAAKSAGLKVKLNTVAMRGINEDEFDDLIRYAGANSFDLTFIEVMPMGDTGFDRVEQFVPLDDVRKDLETRWTLSDSSFKTGGPARYVTVQETGGRLGFISPLTGNFCDGCNRIRLTCTGKLYLCLGQSESLDFREAMRSGASDTEITSMIHRAMGIKPKGHDFDYSVGTVGDPGRHMSVTGG